MIATVTLNPSIDKTLTVSALVPDDTNRAVGIRLDPGGKGINVSRVVREFGGDTIAMGFLGGHNGALVQRALEDEGLETDFNVIDGETRENLILQDRATGHQYRINAPGPYVRVEEGERLKRKLSAGWENEPDYIVFSGSIPPGLPKDMYRELILDARSRGLRTVLDADGPAFAAGLTALPTLIKPNRYELERHLGHPIEGEEAFLAAGRELVGQGIEIVVVSDGSHAAYVVTADEAWVAVPPRIEVLSGVGAGDSMVAGIVYRLACGADLGEALRWGVAAGAGTAMTPGTELCHLRDVKALLDRVELRRVSAVAAPRH